MIDKKPIIHHEGNYELAPLFFELAGVFNVEKILNKDGVEKILNFYKNGHPSKNIKYTPALVQRLFEKNDKIIAIFFATERVNENSKEKLFSFQQLLDYRIEFDLEFNKEWSCMSYDEIKEQYF